MEKLTKIFGSIVPTFFTAIGGVSISEIGRIQAENKQKNDTFWGGVTDAMAGVFQEELSYLGGATSTRKLPGVKIGRDELMHFQGVADRNAQTATLMHALKVYKRLQGELERKDLRLYVVGTLPDGPVRPSVALRGTVCETEVFMDMSNIDEMIAALNPQVLAQFNLAFWKRANELNSRAAAIGKLLSEKDSFFRELIKPLPKGNRQVTQSGWAITQWEKTYSTEELTEFSRLRDELQIRYDDLQKQLNGCRKQIKDAVRAYNLDQEHQYQTAFGSYKVEAEKHSLEMERIRSAAETLRQQAASELAALKVRVE